jgi:hypothetical protein
MAHLQVGSVYEGLLSAVAPLFEGADGTEEGMPKADTGVDMPASGVAG